jgi:hypothetical protein
MERGEPALAQHFLNKTLNFLEREAPDQVENFTRLGEALRLRQEMGWYRLLPEQSHQDLLAWYKSAREDVKHSRIPEDTLSQYLY